MVKLNKRHYKYVFGQTWFTNIAESSRRVPSDAPHSLPNRKRQFCPCVIFSEKTAQLYTSFHPLQFWVGPLNKLTWHFEVQARKPFYQQTWCYCPCLLFFNCFKIAVSFTRHDFFFFLSIVIIIIMFSQQQKGTNISWKSLDATLSLRQHFCSFRVVDSFWNL